MENKKIAIFPASGKLGGSLVKHALGLIPAHHLVLISRYPTKIPESYRDAGATVRAADYDSPKTLENAFSQVKTLFLISYPTFQHEHRTKVRSYMKSVCLLSFRKHLNDPH